MREHEETMEQANHAEHEIRVEEPKRESNNNENKEEEEENNTETINVK